MKIRINVILCIITLATISCNIHKKQENQIVNIYEAADTAVDNDVLSSLLNQSRVTNKYLFLVFGFESCSWCRIFERYHNDTTVRDILGQYFIVAEIDYHKTPGGKDLYRQYGSEGFPSWTIMDSKAKVLLDSRAPIPGVVDRKSNIGYPHGTDELKYYLFALKTAAPAIKDNECAMLTEKLNFYREYK